MKSTNTFNIADYYILSWVAMDILGIFRVYDSLSVLLFGFVSLVALVCGYKVFKEHEETPCLKALSILFIMFAIYGFWYILSGKELSVQFENQVVNNRKYLKDIASSLLPIFAFYYLTLKGYLNQNKMRIWIFVIFIVSFFVFMARQRESLENVFINSGQYVENTTNNASYIILGLFPALVLFKDKKILFYSGLAFCMSFVLMGAKRGAILVAAFCSLFLLYDDVKYSNGKKKIIVLVASVVFFFIAYDFIVKYYSENTYLQMRLEQTMEGNTSSRTSIWSNLIHYFFSQQNPLHILFGLGANGTLTVGVNYAHNDWLEILINQGAVGFCIYLYYWIILFRTRRKSKKVPMAYMALTQVVIILFLKTFMSMSYSEITYPTSMVFGYYLGQLKLYKG